MLNFCSLHKSWPNNMCECTHLVQYTHYLANSSPNSSEVLATSSKSEDAKKYQTGL